MLKRVCVLVMLHRKEKGEAENSYAIDVSRQIQLNAKDQLISAERQEKSVQGKKPCVAAALLRCIPGALHCG